MATRRWTKEEIATYREKSSSMFYFNREDSNIFIPRRYGYGFSLNYASPVSWLIILALVSYFVWSFFFRN